MQRKISPIVEMTIRCQIVNVLSITRTIKVFGKRWRDIAAYNQIESPYAIFVGQQHGVAFFFLSESGFSETK